MITINCEPCFNIDQDNHPRDRMKLAKTIKVDVAPSIGNVSEAVSRHLKEHHPDQMFDVAIYETYAGISWITPRPIRSFSVMPLRAPTVTFRHPRALAGAILGLVALAAALTRAVAGLPGEAALWVTIGALWAAAGYWADNHG